MKCRRAFYFSYFLILFFLCPQKLDYNYLPYPNDSVLRPVDDEANIV
jgi:hypothetical protein